MKTNIDISISTSIRTQCLLVTRLCSQLSEYNGRNSQALSVVDSSTLAMNKAKATTKKEENKTFMVMDILKKEEA